MKMGRLTASNRSGFSLIGDETVRFSQLRESTGRTRVHEIHHLSLATSFVFLKHSSLV